MMCSISVLIFIVFEQVIHTWTIYTYIHRNCYNKKNYISILKQKKITKVHLKCSNNSIHKQVVIFCSLSLVSWCVFVDGVNHVEIF